MFGMELGSDKLLASLGPPHMSRKMGKELFDYPTDILSLPGAWSTTGVSNGDYEAQHTFSQLSEFLQAPHSKHRVHDSGWNSLSHHALGKVKTPEALTMLADDYLATKSRAGTYEVQRLKEWMRRHHYSDREMEEYHQTGGLPLVLRALANLYNEMLTGLRTATLKHGAVWEGSYAQAMLEYHKKELGHIRAMAGNRKDFLLTTYTYLRDSAKTKWTNQEIQSIMCMELNASLLSSTRAREGEATDRRRACRCQNQALHTLLQVSYYDIAATLCPVAASTTAQHSRTAAKILKTKVDGHVRQSGGPPPRNTWQGWAAKAVEAAAAGQSSI